MPSGSWRCWASGLARYGLTLHPDKTRFVDFRFNGRRGRPPGGGRHDVRLPRLHPRLGTVAEGQQRRAAGDGQGSLRARAGSGHGLVPAQPASPVPRAACPSVAGDPGPLRLLRHHRQRPTDPVVPPSGRADLEEVALTARPPQQLCRGRASAHARATSLYLPPRIIHRYAVP